MTPVMQGRLRARAVQTVVVAALLLMAALAVPRAATADVGSDHPAAILVFPKLLVDTVNGIDTLIRVTNVSSTAINVKCFYVNATPQCSLEDATSCFPDRLSCFREVGGQLLPGTCFPQWQETDFFMRLTQEQPTGWLVSGGENVNCAFLNGVCSQDHVTPCNDDGDCGIRNRCIKPPCFPLDGGLLGRSGPGGQNNETSAVPLSPEDPFIGELKCIALDESGEHPVARNDLIGTALIGRTHSGPEAAVEVSGYNAIGIPALTNECLPSGRCSITNTPCQDSQQCAPTNNQDKTLVLGGPADKAEYDGCPNVLILDHFLDGAADPVIANVCNPDGTCSVSGTPCENDNNCVDNICLPAGSCSVTKTPCAAPGDCQNTCITTNTCVAGSCSVTGAACSGTNPCLHNFCTLSGNHCSVDEECPAPTFQARIVTELTLVPCTEDFESQQTVATVAQFLVFNEFEQRFSASTTVECFKEIPLSNIDTVQSERSIFTVGAMGTLTGQTRIRGVVNKVPNPLVGNALLGVAEEFRCAGPKYDFPRCNFVDQPERLISSAAKNLHFQGRRPQADFIYLPPQ
jgi:hypothetical protein